ncbi:replication factor C large subunit [Candidatus Micrarchaeota archaeon]|nr:replication factor C large subunit [Candidatus Micrarchaeota archaeon]
MSQLWTEKFAPKNLEEFIGNTDVVQKALLWSKEWNKGRIQKPLFFFGSTGSGKTALAYLLAKINSWGIFELNASDFRNKDSIERIAGAASMNSSFSGEKRLVLLDEIDGLSAVDRGGSAAITKILKEAQNPVILTANEIYSDKKLLPIRTNSTLIQFKKINYLSMAKRLKEICIQEGIEFEEEAIETLAKNSSGDMRSALIDLQTLGLNKKISLDDVNFLGYRERQEDVFKVLRKIFTADSFAEARNARFSSNADSNLLMKWIEENIPRQFSSSTEICSAFDSLSKADIFNGRIRRRQNYGFLRYSSELMTTGVSLAKEKPNKNFVMYQFPKVLRLLSSSKSQRELKHSLALKLSKEIRSSSREILSADIPFVKQAFSDKEFAVDFTARFDLTDKEAAFLLDTKPETKKVKSLIEQAKIKKKSMFSGRKPLSGITSSLLSQIESGSEEKQFSGKTASKEKPEQKTEKEEKQSTLGIYFS